MTGSDSRQPLLDMLANLSEPDMQTLFNVLDIAHMGLIYESTDEYLLMDQFMTSLWIATRGATI